MARRSSNAYDNALGLSETIVADTFETEFPAITGWTIEILAHGESPDRIAPNIVTCARIITASAAKIRSFIFADPSILSPSHDIRPALPHKR
jgi:hypothetical protein